MAELQESIFYKPKALQREFSPPQGSFYFIFIDCR